MTICKKCMAQYDEKYGVCPKCGTPFEIPLPQMAVLPLKPKRKNNKGLIVGIIVAIITLIIGAVILIASFSNSNGSNELEQQISLGEKYLTEENYEEAIVAFKKAIEIEQNDPELYIQLAEAYLGKSDTDNAIKALENGYKQTGSDKIKKKLDEVKYNKYLSLGEKAFSASKYDEAIENFEKAIELKPTGAKPYISESDCYIAKNDNKKAKAILKKGYEVTKSEEIKKKLDELKNDDYSDLTIETGDLTNNDIKSEWEDMEHLQVKYPIFNTNNVELRKFLYENITRKILSVTDDNYIIENKLAFISSSFSYCYPIDGYLSLRCDTATSPLYGNGNRNHPSSYFVDLKTKKILTLNDLFTESNNEVSKELTEKLNKYVDKRILFNKEIKYEEVYKHIENKDMIFTLDKNNLTIIFSPYEISPGGAGTPAIKIPFSELNLKLTIPEIKTKKDNSIRTTMGI